MTNDPTNRFQIPADNLSIETTTPLWIDLFAANGIFGAIMGAAFQLILWLGVVPGQPLPAINVAAVMLPLSIASSMLLYKQKLKYRALRIAAWLVFGMAVISVLASTLAKFEASAGT